MTVAGAHFRRISGTLSNAATALTAAAGKLGSAAAVIPALGETANYLAECAYSVSIAAQLMAEELP